MPGSCGRARRGPGSSADHPREDGDFRSCALSKADQGRICPGPSGRGSGFGDGCSWPGSQVHARRLGAYPVCRIPWGGSPPRPDRASGCAAHPLFPPPAHRGAAGIPAARDPCGVGLPPSSGDRQHETRVSRNAALLQLISSPRETEKPEPNAGAVGCNQIRISESEIRNKFKAQMLQCSKQGNPFDFGSSEYCCGFSTSLQTAKKSYRRF